MKLYLNLSDGPDSTSLNTMETTTNVNSGNCSTGPIAEGAISNPTLSAQFLHTLAADVTLTGTCTLYVGRRGVTSGYISASSHGRDNAPTAIKAKLLYVDSAAVDPYNPSGGEIIATLIDTTDAYTGSTNWGTYTESNPSGPGAGAVTNSTVTVSLGTFAPSISQSVLTGNFLLFKVYSTLTPNITPDGLDHGTRTVVAEIYSGGNKADYNNGNEYSVFPSEDPDTMVQSYIEIVETVDPEEPDPVDVVDSDKIVSINFVTGEPVWRYMQYGTLSPQCVSKIPYGAQSNKFSVMIGTKDPLDTSKGYIIGQNRQLDKLDMAPADYAVDILQSGTEEMQSVIIFKEFSGGDPEIYKMIKKLAFSFGQPPIASVGASEVDVVVDATWDATASYTNLFTQVFGTSTGWKTADIETFKESIRYVNLQSRAFKVRLVHTSNAGAGSSQTGRLYFNGMWIHFAVMSTRKVNF